MENKTKKIIIAGSIAGVVIAVAGFFIVRKRKATAIEKALLASVDNNGSNNIAANKLIEYPIRFGYGYVGRDAERSYVMVVQTYLNKKIKENNIYGLAPLVVDGRFGAKTEDALMKIAGTKQVTYTLYTQMQNYLIPVLLRPNVTTNEDAPIPFYGLDLLNY
jgi:hypothetical protein